VCVACWYSPNLQKKFKKFKKETAKMHPYWETGNKGEGIGLRVFCSKKVF
jgi:hypothetical protein